MSGKILNAIKAIYNNVQYCIRLNGLYINSLAETIKHLGLGVDVGGEK